jgi:hypothetical protein
MCPQYAKQNDLKRACTAPVVNFGRDKAEGERLHQIARKCGLDGDGRVAGALSRMEQRIAQVVANHSPFSSSALDVPALHDSVPQVLYSSHSSTLTVTPDQFHVP